MNMMKITGTNKVIANIRKAGIEARIGMERGLMRGGRFLQRESQLIVPVDTANLKNSAFTRNIGGRGFSADVLVGYTANYAVYVHEDLNAHHKSGKTAKYLERPAREKRTEIIAIVNEEVKP